MSSPPIQPEGQSVAAPHETPLKQPFDEVDYKRRLIEEYKILQDKIDKIGGFRFTIKGWSVTAVIAASAAGSATQRLAPVVTISTGLALMLVFFFWFEFKQVKLSRIFGERARKLEEVFRQLDRRSGGMTKVRIPVPFTAHEIVIAGSRQKPWLTWNHSWLREKAKPLRRFFAWVRVARQADLIFYFVLVCMAFLLPLIPHHSAIGAHWKEWTGNTQHPANSTAHPTPKQSEVPR